MSVKERIQPFKILGSVAKVAALGIGAGFLGIAGITLRLHRELTHRSITLHPTLQEAIDFEERTLNVESGIWAAVHRIHHQMPDVALAPFARITNAVSWIREDPHRSEGIKIPETFPFLDPFVKEFTLNQVVEIGSLANEFMREKLGNKYRAPENYTAEELKKLLNPTEPQYWYPKRPRGKYTQKDYEDLLLGDPHSPVRIPPPLNGVRVVLTRTPSLYKVTADLFKAHPELIPKDLQTKVNQNRKLDASDIALGFVVANMAVFVARGKYTPKDALTAAISGSAINGIRIGFELLGTGVVNSLGHSGLPTEAGIVRAVKGEEYKPTICLI